MKGTIKDAIQRGIGGKFTIRTKLGFCVYQCGAWITIGHVGTVKYVRHIILLLKKKTSLVHFYGDVDKIMEFTKVSHFEFLVKSCKEGLKQRRGRGCENNIIDIQVDVGELHIVTVDKQRHITNALNKANLLGKDCKTILRSPRNFLKAIKEFLEKTHMIWFCFVNKSQ